MTDSSGLLKNIDQLANARHFGLDQIIGQHHGERLVADQIAGAQHRVTQGPTAFFAAPKRPRSSRRFCANSDHLMVAAVDQHLLQFRRFVEMIFDAVLAAAGDENDLFDAGVHRLLHDVLDRRNIDDRQQLLGYGFGRREEIACPAQPRE